MHRSKQRFCTVAMLHEVLDEGYKYQLSVKFKAICQSSVNWLLIGTLRNRTAVRLRTAE